MAVENEAFFPWQVGDSWVYETSRKGRKDSFEMRVVIEGPWKEKGQSGMIMTQRDKRGQMREFLLMNAQGVFIHKLGLKKSISPEVDTVFTPPVPKLMFPLTPGATVHWEGRLKVAWVDRPITFDGRVVGWEDVKVPAGTFRCIRVHYDEMRGDEKVVEDAWYAPGVGQVKYDGGEYVKELKTYNGASR